MGEVFHFSKNRDSEYLAPMGDGKRIISVALDEASSAAFDMLLADLNNADPAARWTRETLAASMLEQVIEDDFLLNRESERALH